ncbi:MAG: CbiX/SirB N-terminal domain-containing protein [Pseudomonadota bacterium]
MNNQNYEKSGLIIFSHGSKRASSINQILQLTECMKQNLSQRFSHVNAAFLEFAQPNLLQAVAEHHNLGMENVVVFPYFLTPGKHVESDIPEEMEKIKAQYSRLRLSCAPFMASHPNWNSIMTSVILDHVNQAH